MSWNEVTITEEGIKLLSEMINGSKLIFSRAEIGGGTVSEDELTTQTVISELISAPALIAGIEKSTSANGSVIRIQIRNDGVGEESRMHQIGLFAKTDHHSEVLFGLLQDKIGEEIPTYASFPQFLLEIDVTVGIGRTNNIEVIVPSTVYATIEQLNALAKSIEGNGKINLKPVSLYERDSSKPNYLDGDEVITQVSLEARGYTGAAEAAIIMSDGVQYDAENISQDAETAPNGNLILEEE